VKIVPPEGAPYWLSYRAPIGYDAQLENRYLNTLQVHRAAFGGDSYLITGLTDGAMHRDDNLNLTIRQLSHTADSATLEVQYGAAFTLSTSSLVFGIQSVNRTSSAQTITLLSNGGTTLSIASITFGGTNPFQFEQTNNCGTSLAPGASCAIDVTFKPTSTGSKVATLIVTASGGAGTKATSLSGTGAASTFTLSPTSLAFGIQAQNTTSSAQTVTLRSTGIKALPITSIVIDGEYAQTNNCGTSLDVGASCAIYVTFKPLTPGSKVGTLSVTGGNGAGTNSVTLAGNGWRSSYTLSTSSLAFGNQALNLASSAKAIILHSTGITPLPITSIFFGGINPLQFTQTNDCGTSVAAGASCTISVRFKPTSTGSKAATLIVNAGGGAGKKSVTLSGTGVRSTYSVSPTALSFGNVARTATSAAKSVKISNTGSVVLPISSITLAGTNPGQFARTSNCPARVAVGSSCTVSVVFKPTSTGAKSATLQVTPSGGAAPRSVALSGTGI
jgi:Abnormal spindle-like microcephaly-assoc'd, ASPM-SPD-2-Hydin